MRALLGLLVGLLTATGSHAAPNLRGLQPHCQRQLSLARLQLTSRGIPYRITSAFRSRAEQARLYRQRRRNRYPVGRPGHSAHERGLAVDISFGGLRAAAAQVMRRCGWRQTVKSDPIHWECFHLARPKKCDKACRRATRRPVPLLAAIPPPAFAFDPGDREPETDPVPPAWEEASEDGDRD